jgi:hypothetical protein
MFTAFRAAARKSGGTSSLPIRHAFGSRMAGTTFVTFTSALTRITICDASYRLSVEPFLAGCGSRTLGLNL